MILFFGFEVTGKEDFESSVKEAQQNSPGDPIGSTLCYMKIEDRNLIGVMMNYNVYYLRDLSSLKNTVKVWLQGHKLSKIAYAASRANWAIIPLGDSITDEEGSENESEKRVRFKL